MLTTVGLLLICNGIQQGISQRGKFLPRNRLCLRNIWQKGLIRIHQPFEIVKRRGGNGSGDDMKEISAGEQKMVSLKW
uniref:Pentatricopeptide repeat-containing protein At1g06710 isoform X1 n=1 Tax=Rhizophora mucronata TaxID=61149 RepID=A0A2P2QPV3_RHIMU